MVFDITRLKKIRKQLSLTQNQFAKESGISQSMVAKIESGKLDPTYSKVKKIEQALEKLSNKDSIKLEDIMVKRIISVKPSNKISEIVKIMAKHSISQVPVIDGSGMVVGLISESTILRREGINKNTIAKQIMDDSPPIISQEANIEVIKKLLSYYTIVLIKKHGDIVGLITRADLIKSLA